MLRNSIYKKLNNWIASNYGSKKGLFFTHYYKILYFLGMYRKYTKINWVSIERVVFICKGNICRSAYADVVANEFKINAISCGVHAHDSARANDRAILAASLKNISLQDHLTTPFNSIEFKSTDLLVAMEPWQAEIAYEAQKGNSQITLLGLWVKRKQPYVHDPYGLSPEYFNHCFTYIHDAVEKLKEKLKS